MTDSYSGLHDPYTDQLAAARYRAERDQARQELVIERFKRQRIGRTVWRLQNRLSRAHRRERQLRKGLRMWREKAIEEPQVTMSAYDLLPEEDREALRWVREHGGLESVEARLMPEGYEWPRFEDGGPVKIGDEFAERVYGDPCRVGHFAINKYAFLIFDEEDMNHNEAIDHGTNKRVKRPAPKALDADGAEIRVGDTVWDIYTGERMAIVGFKDVGCTYQTCRVTLESGEQTTCDGPRLTHRAPVIAADGRPLLKGETVYDIEDKHGYPHTVVSTELDGLEHVKTTSEQPSPARNSIHPSRLTHERPDSWERLEEDAGCTATKYNERRGTIFTTKQQVARDLVRRAKKLAGVDND